MVAKSVVMILPKYVTFQKVNYCICITRPIWLVEMKYFISLWLDVYFIFEYKSYILLFLGHCSVEFI